MGRTRTYSEYLKLDELLSLQVQSGKPDEPDDPAAPEHDEMLFIVIHQVYELWFKEILHELDYLSHSFHDKRTPTALHTLKRVLTILKTLVGQIDVLETMTPLQFTSFRDRLASASGFESAQFRELEFVLGHKRLEAIERFPRESPARATLERRYGEPSLWNAFLNYLANHGYELPAEVLARDVTEPTAESAAVQAVLIDVYRNNSTLAQVCERLVDMDEGIQEWRYRHIKMVQRTIGTKHGTGGSSGAAYLQTTLFKALFPDLWAIRAEL